MEKEYVVVFGGCGMDYTFLQQKDGGYLKVPSISAPGGKGSNQAVALSRAGINVKIISRLGENANNPISKQIIDNLKANGVDTSLIDIKANKVVN